MINTDQFPKYTYRNGKICNVKTGKPIKSEIKDGKLVARLVDKKGRRMTVKLELPKGKRKLNEKIVKEIRKQRMDGAKLKELANQYGVHQSTISEVCNQVLYKKA